MAIPQELGRYRIEAELGQGAMGRVYLGHDPAIDRKVALKTIHLPRGLPEAERAEAEARFHREIQAAGRLSHPHIVTIYDVGQDAQAGTFVAMEYVEGRTLEETIGDGELPDPRVVASVGCQAADALAYAHRNGIVHRDIKPANLILVGGRSVKITDFGLAKPSGSSLTSDGTLLGTPYYMSPEQIEGRTVDGRSDLFSLAVVVYELLTGKRPFRGDSVSTVVYRILHEPPVEPDLGRLASGSAIKGFLARALAKDPDRRFPDGDAFARALREAMSAEEAGGREAPAPVPAAAVPPAVTVAPGAEKDGAGPVRGRPYRASRQGQRKVKLAAGQGNGARKRKAPRHGRFAGRPRRAASAMPVVFVLALVAVLSFVYRDALFELARPWILDDQSTPGLSPAGSGPSPAEIPSPGPGAGEEEPAQVGTPNPSALPAGESEPPPLIAGEKTGGDPGAAVPAEGPLPAEAAAPPPGGVRLRSEPGGAVFEVEGRTLPAAILPTPEGDARVVVRAILGCRSGEEEVSAAAAGQVVTVVLANDIIPVRVEADPGKADVSLDGEKVGRTPVSLALDACVEHEIKVEKAEHKPWVGELKLADGRLDAPEKITANLEALPRGTLVTPSPPYEVSMVLAGRRLKPGEEISLVADTYRLSLRNDKFLYRREVRVRIRANRKVAPEVDFPGLARFSVLAAPSNVNLEVRVEDGKLELGAPPITGQQVVAGTYTFYCRFQHNGEEQAKTVELGPGDNPPVRFVAGKP